LPVVYFDGQADGLAIANGCGKLRDFTLVIVAAPFSNLGNYRGIFAANQAGRNDYQSGINLDLGKEPGTSLSKLNVEGAGFSGEKNLGSITFTAPSTGSLM